MGYVVYDSSLYRTGFRPIGDTNPYLATQLGAVPFRPDYLHGMGQAHPFTDAGGYMLHGLGDIVPDQAVLSYSGKWQNTSTQSPQDVINVVTAALAQDGLAVRNVSSDAGMLANTKLLGIAELTSFNVKMQLQVTNGMGFGDPSDVISIIRHEVYVATGKMPLADSIPTVQAPGGGAATQTGQPLGPGAAEDWSSWLQDNFSWIAMGAAALVLLPIVLGRR